MNDDDVPAWAPVLGALLVSGVLLLFTLNAIGGWGWTKEFLTSSASGWMQGIGAVLALVATWIIARRETVTRRRTEAMIARLTAARIEQPLLSMQSACNFATQTLGRGVVAFDISGTFASVHEKLKSVNPPTEEQILRIAAVSGAMAQHVVRAITLLDQMTFVLEPLVERHRVMQPTSRRAAARDVMDTAVKMLSEVEGAQALGAKLVATEDSRPTHSAR